MAVARLFLIGCIGLTSVVATVDFLNLELSKVTSGAVVRPPNSSCTNSESTKWTLGSVRRLAKKVGSRFLDTRIRNVCSSAECLDSAARILHSINFSVNPCDDFFEYACGGWIAENKIPPTWSQWDHFYILTEKSTNITQEILSDENDPNDPKSINQAKEFYKDCINVDAREAVGVKPILDGLQQPRHGNWPILIGSLWKLESFDWLQTIVDLRRDHEDNAIISIYVDKDPKHSDSFAIFIDQPSLVLPRDILINSQGSSDDILAAYKEYIVSAVRILAAAGNESPEPQNVEKEAQELIAFEKEIAMIMTAAEFRTDTSRMYNPFKIKDYQMKTDSYGDLSGHLLTPLHWLTFLKAIFKRSGVALNEDTQIIVVETEYFEKLIQLLLKTDPRTIANYVHLRYIYGLGGETNKAMTDIAFKLKKISTGAKTLRTIEKRCAVAANDAFGLAIGLKYVDAIRIDEEGIAEVKSMVKNLRVSFKQLLTEATWMDASTRRTAQDKVNKMRSLMGYPTWYKDRAKVKLGKYFAKLKIVPSNYFRSVTQLHKWEGDKALSKFGTSVDWTEWTTTPVDANAYYEPNYNRITFPAAILQAPFFKHGNPASLNYGGIGTIIGHEITHGFDDSGHQYDATGETVNWWSNRTLAKFKEKANCIRDQYSAYKSPEVNLHVNGLLTLDENIADNGGIRESFLAYTEYIRKNGVERPLPGLEKLQPLQLFFLGYATVWCSASTLKGLKNQLLTAPHCPSNFRVRGSLSSSADFAKIWKCPSGSVMNPSPGKRCILW